MWNLEFGFDRPAFLWLLLILPVFWVLSFQTLAALGNVRRLTVILLRTFVALLFIFALAEMQFQRFSDKVTVIFLLDQSESIPHPKRELMREYVVQQVRANRDVRREDRAGVIVFGRDAAIEVPPFDDDIPDTGSFEAFLPRRDATNLESALRLAQASFPEDTAKRIVVVTDGNENVGDALSVAPSLANNGIGIDVVPVELTTRAEVAIEKLTIPADIRRGTPFEVRAVLNNYMESSQPDAATRVGGRLRLTRTFGGQDELIGEEHVELSPGKTAIGFRHVIDKPAMYTYQAEFIPFDTQDDLMPHNNRASAFTHVRGKGRVLLIEDCDHPGQFDFLIERLRLKNLELDVQSSDELFTSLNELQGYDCIVLANVPRSSGEDAMSVSSFRDEQIAMLVRNTQQMGCGLVLLGGPNSLGAGGWANTELEAAMPVDFQIKNAKIEAVGALVLMMHASELAQGNHYQKVVAREAVKMLGPMDYCGLIHWDNWGKTSWLWSQGNQGLVRISGQRKKMLARLGKMAPGDMPDFEPGMKMALTAFNGVPASIKHMIVISDGDPNPPFGATVKRFKKAGVKITTVAVGTHGPAGSTPLKALAKATGGQYYVVTNPKILPKIYQREVRRVARPLVKDLDNVSPRIVYPHEIMLGIEGQLPPISGMVLTTVKENPLVEVVVRSPIPQQRQNSTILAAWTYGLGRAAVVTTDAGHQWASAWTGWENYDKFYSQLVRWAMRPSSDRGKYTVATDVRDGKVRVVVTALNPDDEFRNFLDMSGSAIAPDLKPFPIGMRQLASGRYVGEFPVDQAGSYHLSIVPHPGEPPILTGVNVPYSAEYRDRDTNIGLLETLVTLHPEGGQAGVLAEAGLAESEIAQLLAIDSFRPDLPPAISIKDIWPLLLLLSAVVFLCDVFVRRVAVTSDWVLPAVDWVTQRFRTAGSDKQVQERLDRLRNRKAELTRSIDERRAAARFEPQTDDQQADEPPRDLETVLQDATAASPTTSPGDKSPPPAVDQSESDSYTARLLEAKHKALKEQQKKLRRD